MDNKVYRQKEMHLFFYDYNGYYSSLQNKYIKLISNTQNIEEDENILKFGFFISNLTNTIFILPQFRCNRCSRECKYCKNHTYCSFIEFWKIRSLNKYFKDKYRESVYMYYNIY